MSSPPEDPPIYAMIAASREVTHAASHAASVAALVARRHGVDSGDATSACMEAAKAAFVLDDIYRRNNGSLATLEAADAALARAEAAVRAARTGIACLRGPRVVATAEADAPA